MQKICICNICILYILCSSNGSGVYAMLCIKSTGVIHNSMQGLNLQLCNTKKIILNIH